MIRIMVDGFDGAPQSRYLWGRRVEHRETVACGLGVGVGVGIGAGVETETT